MKGFRAKVLKEKVGLSDTVYRQIREIFFYKKQCQNFNYYEIFIARIGKYIKLKEGNHCLNYFSDFKFDELIEKIHEIGIDNLVSKHVIFDVLNKNIDLYESKEEVGSYYSKIVYFDMKEVTVEHIKSFRTFNHECVYSQETACELLGISKSLFLKWNSNLKIIPLRSDLSSLQLFLFKVLKRYIKDGNLTLDNFINIEWSSFSSFLLLNDFKEIESYYFNFNNQTQELKLFKNFAESDDFNPSITPTPFKFFLDEHFQSFEIIYMDKFNKSKIIYFPTKSKVN